MHIQRYAAVLLLPLLSAGIACGQAGKIPAPQKEELLESAAPSHRGFLGVSIRDMRPSLAREMKIDTKTGALVTGVSDNSPAEKAGIKEHDVIIEFNGTTIDEANDLIRAVRKAAPDSRANIVVVRNTGRKVLQTTLGTLPQLRMLAEPEIPHMPRVRVRVFSGQGVHGLHLMDLNPQLAEYFGAPDGKGILVEKVDKRSAALEAGFKAGDVILRVGKNDVGDVEDFRNGLETYEEGDSAAIAIVRRGARLTLNLGIDEAEESGNFHFRSQKGLWHFDDDSRMFKLDNMRHEEILRELKEELRGVGREIRSRVDMLRNTVSRGLRQVAG